MLGGLGISVSTVCINNLECGVVGNISEPLTKLTLPFGQCLALGKERALAKLLAKEKSCGWVGKKRLLVNLRLPGDGNPTGLPGRQQPKEAAKLSGLLERQRALKTTANAEEIPLGIGLVSCAIVISETVKCLIDVSAIGN